MFDIAIVETGSGGDAQIVGNDLGLVYGLENQPYLAMFGGNIEQSTVNNVVLQESFDYWGNSLLLSSDQTIQFNSELERKLRTTPLTSSGRQIIQNAISTDLSYIVGSFKSPVDITVSIISDDWLQISLKITVPTGTRVIVINFRKQLSDGDFYLFDFNDDFY